MKTKRHRYLVVLGAIVLVGALALAITQIFWDRIAVAAAPTRQAATARTALALEADKLFWAAFHGNRYTEIQHVLDVMTAAYLETPNDAVTAAHVAWLHMWRVGERGQNPNAPATITDDLVLARKYFQTAVALDPKDARYLGFLAAAMMSEAKIDRDEKLTRQGYFTMRDAVKAWPEFNLFTEGYVLSGLPPASKQYADALEDQWKNMDVCAKTTVDRAHPEFGKYIPADLKTGHERACWNSWIAPHNLEGFFLNMGDMLVKHGDWQTAQAIYRDAMAPKEYATWKYRDVLADRIANAQTNVAEFNKPSPATKMMLDSSFACMACHAE